MGRTCQVRHGFHREGHGFNREGHGFHREGHGFNREGHGFNREGHGFNREGRGFNREGHGFLRVLDESLTNKFSSLLFLKVLSLCRDPSRTIGCCPQSLSATSIQ
jgi:hypothetical protein